MTTPIGSTLSHYRILDELGSGGMGVVYLARDERLDRSVAIKFLADELSRDEGAKSRFFRTARAISSLDHPNICSIHEIDETSDGRVFIVMAHYEGETLDRRMRSGPLAVDEALDIGIQVARGLAKAHAHGIVHRDIKPTNLMATGDGLVKILDFGLARVAEASTLTTTGQMLGTPEYMAPEQWRGDHAGPPADVWSVGVLLHGLLAGGVPFQAQNRMAMMYGVLNREPEPLAQAAPGVPAELAAVVGRCLEKDPGRRYADGGELLVALQSVAGTHALDRQRATPAPPSRRRNGPIRPLATRRGVGIMISAPLVALGLWWGGSRIIAEPSPLRVAVLAPEIVAQADSSEIAIAAATIQSALLRGLAGFKGVAVLDPVELRHVGGGPAVVASAAAVDEMVSAAVSASPGEWHVRLRWTTANNTIRWTDEFSVPRPDPLMLANALIARLPQAYPRKPLRPGRGSIRVRPEDYAAFLNLYRSGLHPATASNFAERAVAFDALHRKAPGFLDAWLLDARFSLFAHEVSRDTAYLVRAQRVTERALGFAPEDPRSLEASVATALARRDLALAERRLEELEGADPANPQNEFYQVLLLEKRGRVTEAVSRMTKLVSRRPSVTYLRQLAELEYRNGAIDLARRHLDELIDRSPDDPYAHSKLAQLELLYGSAQRADSIFGKILERTSRSSAVLNNRGLARMLLRRYPAALEDFREAHLGNPTKAVYLLNLADCEGLMGRADSAAAHYHRVLEKSRSDPSASALMWRAQCLAHLGRRDEAVAAVEEGIGMQPEDSEGQYQAALVYALVGDHASALAHAKKAVDKGVDSRWFHLTWFDPLRGDSSFMRLLAARPKA